MSPVTVVRGAVVPVVLGAVLGAVGGWLWWTWWGPAPAGRIYDTQAGPTWYPDPFDPGITSDFSGTATYVVVGVGLALLLGVVGGWLARDSALVGLGAVLLASVLAGLVMTLVGLAQSPPDPQDRAEKATVGEAMPGHLEVTGVTPYLTWPVGSLLGYLVVMLSLTSATTDGSRRPGQPSGEPAPLG